MYAALWKAMLLSNKSYKIKSLVIRRQIYTPPWRCKAGAVTKNEYCSILVNSWSWGIILKSEHGLLHLSIEDFSFKNG